MKLKFGNDMIEMKIPETKKEFGVGNGRWAAVQTQPDPTKLEVNNKILVRHFLHPSLSFFGAK